MLLIPDIVCQDRVSFTADPIHFGHSCLIDGKHYANITGTFIITDKSDFSNQITFAAGADRVSILSYAVIMYLHSLETFNHATTLSLVP